MWMKAEPSYVKSQLDSATAIMRLRAEATNEVWMSSAAKMKHVLHLFEKVSVPMRVDITPH